MLLPNQHHLFDIPDDVTYLNCAYISPSLKSVTEAGRRGMGKKSQPWSITPPDFFKESEEARSLFSQIIDSSLEDIAIIPAVSYGIAIAALNLPIKKDENVVVLEEQFPSNYYVWSENVKRANGELVVVKRPAEGSITSAILTAISEKTAVVALPNCHWTDGAVIDLIKISEKCRQSGSALVLDLAQSAGAMPFSVKEIDPDFVIAPCYKWLLGPYSLGFLYVAPRRQSCDPLEHNWIDRANSEDFTGLVNYRDEFQPGARKFDVGERSNFALMPMAVAALKQLLEWDVENVSETLAAFTETIALRATKLGLNVVPANERASHLMGIRFLDGVPKGLLEKLAERKVYVSVRGNSVRVSPHLYNTDDDAYRLFDALSAVL